MCSSDLRVLQKVREQKVEYIITQHGQPVARLLPLRLDAAETSIVQASRRTAIHGWENYAQAAEQARRNWPPERKSQDLLDEIRG